jgi:hypothetical protein
MPEQPSEQRTIPDTSREAVERVARRLAAVPLDMTIDEFDGAAALLRAMAAKIERLSAELREARLLIPIEVKIADARRRGVI